MTAFTYDETDAVHELHEPEIPEMSATYAASITTHDEALAIYRAAVAAFRANGSYETFAKAITARALADTIFDAAWQAESER